MGMMEEEEEGIFKVKEGGEGGRFIHVLYPYFANVYSNVCFCLPRLYVCLLYLFVSVVCV